MGVKKLVDIIKKEVKESLGCTEIAAIGLAVAAARRDQKPPYRVKLFLDYDTFRNAFSVGVPGGGQGIKDGVLKGLNSDPKKGLEVFRGVTPLEESKLEKLEVKVVDVNSFFIYAIVNENSALIVNRHDNLEYVGPKKKIDEVLSLASSKKEEKFEISYVDVVNSVSELIRNEDVLNLVKRGIELNMGLSERGLEYSRYVINTIKDDGSVLSKMKLKAGIAIEARMRGIDFPAMSVAGSGNQGILTTVPLVVYAKEVGIDERTLHESVLLAWLTTIYATGFLGRLSPFCGLLSKAGAGITAGLAYLVSKSEDKNILETVEQSIVNYLSSVFGSFCDGAKPSCSLKGITSVEAAYNSVKMAVSGVKINPIEGYIPAQGDIVDNYFRNLAKIKDSIDKGYKNSYIKILQGKIGEKW